MRIVNKENQEAKIIGKAKKGDYFYEVSVLAKKLKKPKPTKDISKEELKKLYADYRKEDSTTKPRFSAEEKAVIMSAGGKELLKKISKKEAEDLLKIKEELLLKEKIKLQFENQNRN